MNPFIEILLCSALAFLVGGVIGVQIGWDQSCHYATKLYVSHKTGEILVPAPVRELNGVVWGTAWMKNKICDAR